MSGVHADHRQKGELISPKCGSRSTLPYSIASPAPAYRCKISLDKQKQPPHTPASENDALSKISNKQTPFPWIQIYDGIIWHGAIFMIHGHCFSVSTDQDIQTSHFENRHGMFQGYTGFFPVSTEKQSPDYGAAFQRPAISNTFL